MLMVVRSVFFAKFSFSSSSQTIKGSFSGNVCVPVVFPPVYSFSLMISCIDGIHLVVVGHVALCQDAFFVDGQSILAVKSKPFADFDVELAVCAVGQAFPASTELVSPPSWPCFSRMIKAEMSASGIFLE